MSVENISLSNQEPKKSPASGLAKSALGWINRVISDSVQEVSDFSAMLSAQSSVENKVANQLLADAKARNSNSQNNTNNPDNSEVLTLADKSPSELAGKLVKGQAVSEHKRKPASLKIKTEESGEDTQAGDNSLKANDFTEVELKSVLGVDDESKEDSVNKSPETPEIVVKQDPAASALATELVVSQLQVSSLAVTEEPQTVESKDSEVDLNAKSPSTPTAAVAAATLEKMPDETERNLIDFARNAVQKPRSLESTPQASSIVSDAANIEKNNPTAVVNNENRPQQLAAKFDIPEHVYSQQSLSNPLTSKPEVVSSNSTTLGLSQSFMNSLTSGYSVDTARGNENGSRLGIETLGVSKGALNKASNETNTASMSVNKSSESAQAVSDRAISVSLGANGLDSSLKNEVLKGAKPLTRLQSLATLDRVEAALQKASESKDGTQISLRLDPPDLGTVKVDVSFKEGSLHARISADSAQVLLLLREKAPELQVILRKLGLDVEKVSVSVNSGDSGMFNQGSDSKQGGTERRGGNNFPELADSASMSELLNLDHWVA